MRGVKDFAWKVTLGALAAVVFFVALFVTGMVAASILFGGGREMRLSDVLLQGIVVGGVIWCVCGISFIVGTVLCCWLDKD